MKEADLALEATVTEEGTVRAEWLSDSETTAPPLGAALFKVAVHVVLEPEGKLEGLQPTEDNVTGALPSFPLVVQVVPCKVPLLRLPEASAVVVPVPFSNA